MKKTLAVMVLVLVLCFSVSAGHRVSVSLDPYSFQSFRQKVGDTENTVISKYGFGGGLGYSFEFGSGIVLGADVKADIYSLEDQATFTDISGSAKVGYNFDVSRKVGLYANVKAGLDLQMHDGKTGKTVEFGPEVGIEFRFDEHLDIFASCEGLFAFMEKDVIRYEEFRLTPAIGAGYTF